MKSAFVFGFAILLAATASARPTRVAVPQVASAAQMLGAYEQRRDGQMGLILEGLRNGLLTRTEARTLMSGQRTIAKAVRRAMRDRVITGRELAKVERLLTKADAKIDRLSFNSVVGSVAVGRPHAAPLPRHRIERARPVKHVIVRAAPVPRYRSAPARIIHSL